MSNGVQSRRRACHLLTLMTCALTSWDVGIGVLMTRPSVSSRLGVVIMALDGRLTCAALLQCLHACAPILCTQPQNNDFLEGFLWGARKAARSCL